MRSTRLYALASWILWFLGMTLQTPVDSVLLGFPLAMTVYGWCKADAAMRAVAPPPGATPLIGLSPVLGWIYYICGTRSPWRSAGLLLLGVLVTAAGMSAIVFLPSYIAAHLSSAHTP